MPVHGPWADRRPGRVTAASPDQPGGVTRRRRRGDTPTPTITCVVTNVAFRSSVGSDRVALENWLGEVLGGVPVASHLTVDFSELPADGGVDLVLVDLAPVEDRRPDRDLPTRLHVTYLVAPAHEDHVVAA